MKRVLSMMMGLLLLAGCAGRQPGRTAAETPAPAEIDAPRGEAAAETAAPSGAPGALQILFINVGYGDAALLLYDGHAVLIDTGKKSAAPRVFAALSHMGVEALDAVVLTHTHSDHTGGLTALANNLPVGRVYAASISENKKNGENKVTELCAELGLPLTRLDAGDTLPLTETLAFEALGPLVYDADDDNDNSLVLGLTVNGRRLLFTGDMQFAEEATLLNAGVP
ncbi:MAG: MBL fold metallo-hydrolase, partial [Clostridia bacterium]|nr:MBL fold metallo-hydrolase [Clostridia bacterium]